LQEGPLLRGVLLTLADQSQRLLLAIHHLVVDGVSWRILLEDLQRLLGAQPLPAKTSSTQAWAEHLQSYARSPALQQELLYWQAQLQDGGESLPCDDQAGGLQNQHAISLSSRLDKVDTQRLLQGAPAAYRTQINDLLLTALARVITRWTGETSALVQLEGHGREDLFDSIDLTRTLGWFTSVFPVKLTPQPALADSIKFIKEQLRAVPNKGIGFGALRYLGDEAAQQTLAALAVPRITFNYLGQFDGSFDEPDTWFAPAVEAKGEDQSLQAPLGNWLTINGQVYGGELELDWTFSQAMFEPATIQRLADEYTEELKALIEHCSQPEHRGVTPSDFPLASLNQQQLDGLPVLASQIEDIYPLSPMQQGMLFHTLYEQDGGDYINQLRVDVDGLDSGRFRQAWQATIDRHDILRTGFLWQGDVSTPIQMVHKQVTLECAEYDWRAQPQLAEALDTLAEAERQRGFDLQAAPLLRLTLVRTGEQRYHLIYTNHHILMDGWSNSQLLGEVLQRYDGQPSPAAPGRYRDYIGWLQRQDAQACERFWKEQLLALDEPTRLAQAITSDVPGMPGHAEQVYTLDTEQTRRLSEFARQQKVTVNTLVQAAWLLLLQRCTGQDTVVFGATVSGRPAELKGVEQQIGLFINTLPVVAAPRPDMPVGDWLQLVQERNLALRDFEHTPLYEVQRWAGLGGEALFDNILVFENYPVSEALEKGAPAQLRFGAVGNHEQTNYPLTLSVYVTELLSFDYSYSLQHFSSTVINQLAAGLQQLLLGMLDRAHLCLGDLSLLSAGEHARVEGQSSRDLGSIGRGLNVHQLFEMQAERTPDALALLCADQQLSYGQFNQRANQLAHKLIELGVGPDVRVGIAVERGLDMIVGLLAVLKAGGAYVPLDPEYPQDRLHYMMQDSGIQLLLTQSPLLERLAIPDQLVYLCLDQCQAWSTTEAVGNPAQRSDAENLAYVMYTSGSTGRPKGVGISHNALSQHARASVSHFNMSAADRGLQFSTFNFDAFVEQLYPALICGASVVIRGKELWDSETFYRELIEQGISIVDLSTAYWFMLGKDFAAGEPRDFGRLRQLNLGGEAMAAEGVAAWKKAGLKDACLLNTYGPTEATVSVATHDCTRYLQGDEPLPSMIPLGKALPGRAIYLLDTSGQLPLPGAIGELMIGGDLLARGYHDRPGLTAERFIPDPFSTDGGRLYRSGDLARYDAAGVIDYAGRIDHQVKIRGFRIEMGEIEARLLEQEQVREAIVLAQDGAGGPSLVAYIVPTVGEMARSIEEQAALREQLRIALKDVLPDYMLPAHLLFLESLPLSPNGKLDRKALPAVDATMLQHQYQAPQGGLEEQIAALWSEVLGCERIGRDDNFFELGGHSLDALRLIGMINRTLRLELGVNTLFTAPSVAQMARSIVTDNPRGTDNIILLGGTGQPLFCFHPAGGSVYGYLALAEQLRDCCTVYGVLHQSYLQADWSEASWHAMVQRYVANIRKIQPSGPYHLLGWSLGGSIAMDAASELEAAGEEVRFLGLFDPTPPQVKGVSHLLERDAPKPVNTESEWQAVIERLSLLFPGNAELIGSRLAQEAELTWESIHAWVVSHVQLDAAELERAASAFKAEFDASLIHSVFEDLSNLFAQYAYRTLQVGPHLWWSSDYTEEEIDELDQALGGLVQEGTLRASLRITSDHEGMVYSTELLESFREHLLTFLN
ncbi:non-ribosomal peptide synthetase, partial [Pseudomonas piscis]